MFSAEHVFGWYNVEVSRLDRVRNDDIRKRHETEEPSDVKICESRLRWYGHVRRRDENYIGKEVMRLSVGKRKRGTPKRRWMDCVREDMVTVGAHEDDALDRPRWRRLVRTGDPY